MAKRTMKTNFSLEEVVEQCTRRDSDESEDDISDGESDVSSVDSIAEDLFLDGEGVTLDKETTGSVRVHVYVTTPMTCKEARTYCQTYHTDLSTIRGEEDVQMVHMAAGEAYIQSWFSSLIQETENSCTLMKYEESRIPVLWGALCGHPSLCTSKHPFFCYENLNLALEKKTWEEALDYCRSRETDLAYVDPKVLPNMSNAQTDSVWTGLRFMAGMWFWVSKENVETSIALPSCPPEPYRCGARNAKTGIWENRDCEEKLNFLCI
uniref:C-type lectin domain-containing protein n=1 Tax=Cyprinus carpio TaxID=7962 RepID=A0A8C1G7H9_CYPCA